MIEQTGVIVSVQGQRAEVECVRRSTCGGCTTAGACGTPLLERFLGRKPLLLWVCNPTGALPGDEVVVGIPEEALLKASFVAYLVPLIVMIGGGVVGGLIAETIAPGHVQGLSVLGGTGGLAASLWWLGRFSRARASDLCSRVVAFRRGGGEAAATAMLQPNRVGTRFRSIPTQASGLD